MSWRTVVISSNVKLDYKMNYLVIRNTEETKRISITEIGTLLIDSTAVSLTSYLLNELLKNKVNIIFCDEKRLPASVLLPLCGNCDTSLKVRNQIAWTDSSKDAVWAEIVKSKIRGQIAVCKYKEIIDERMTSYLSSVQPGDITNREGHCAKVYFNNIFGIDFTRSDNSPTNVALNYGYGILLSTIAKEIACSGYINQIGIHHNNVHNKLNFACDLMEPFRPFVDLIVIDMQPKEFEHDEKMNMVRLLNMNIKIDGQNQYMTQAIKTYIRSVFNALESGDISEIELPEYEL